MVISKNKAILQENVEGNLLLYNHETNKVICLNKAATNIWKLIEEEVKEELLERFLELYCFKNESEKEMAIDNFEKVVLELESAGCVIRHQ